MTKGRTDRAVDSGVAVIIPCYKHSRFLGEAIESVLAQTRPAAEIVVVDDGSPDDTRDVAARYDRVRCISQTNQGLASARNTGIRETRSPYLVFLDADDRLLPDALRAGAACLEAHAEAGFVSGGFHHIGPDGAVIGEDIVPSIGADHYVAMLRRSYITMHATVMFRRWTLESINGFDPGLRVCEDYDVYLRIVRTTPVRCHSAVVAEYRRHESNVTNRSALMLATALRVLRSQWAYVKNQPVARDAYREGERLWKSHYGGQLFHDVKLARREGQTSRAVIGALDLMRLAPQLMMSRLRRALVRRLNRVVKSMLPPRMLRGLMTVLRRHHEPPPVREVRLGDLNRRTPISYEFGFDRGLPVDRYYIEAFLRRHAADIQGRVLEVGDNEYTRTFGGSRVVASDILHVNPEAARATVIADLADAPQIPSATFDCVVLTQTLHLIYDIRAAIRTLHRILKPGGVLLVTVPGITRIEHGVPGNVWYWSFTTNSLQRVLQESFPVVDIQIEDHGNVFAAVAFLHGLALQEVSTEALDQHDPAFPVTVAARAVRTDHPS